MTAVPYATYAPRGSIGRRFLSTRFVAVGVVVLGILLAWYVAAWLLNAPFQRDLDKTAGRLPGFVEFVEMTWEQERPVLPSPHQVVREIWNTTGALAVNGTGSVGERLERLIVNKRSLVYHGWITLSSTLLGFAFGTLLGILLAIAIVHVRSLDRSLMPWIVSSQMIPILAIAPMIVVVTFNGFTGIVGLPPDFSRLIAKALISTYLSFFPVTVGMVKGLRSPEPIHLDLMRTYSATRSQAFWKLRWPASLPFLFVSMKIAIAASLVGAIVGELPTGAVAGLGARLLTGSYYGQTVQIWAALVLAAVTAGVLVGLIGIANRIVLHRMGGRP